MKWIVWGLLLMQGGWLGMVRAGDEETAELWKRVLQAQKDGLPRTAIAQLEKIYPKAVAGRRWGEALKALVWRTTAQAAVADESGEERIRRLTAEESLVPTALRPLVRGILAHWYWDYFQENRWRFARRMAVPAGDGGDFTTWDLRRLVAHVDGLYRGLLEEQATLAKIPLSEFAGFLDPGDQPAVLRPTLFDFLAREAIDFYASAESDAVRPEEPFDIAADSPALAPAAEFVQARLASPDPDAPRYRALLAFQQLLRLHRDDANPGAFLDHDLARLSFARQAAVGEGGGERYLARLAEITARHASHPLAATAWERGAEELFSAGRRVEALALAERGSKTHPGTPGGVNCAALVRRILGREVALTGERNGLPDRPGWINVTYRNLPTLTLRVVRDTDRGDPTGPDGGRRFCASSLGESELKELIAQRPLRQWTVALPPTADYLPHTQRVELPPLAAGDYVVLASCREDFALSKNAVASALLQVSGLALVVRSRQGRLEGLLVRAEGGEPVAGGEVKCYETRQAGRTIAEVATARSDEAGCFALPGGSPGYSPRLLIVRTTAGERVMHLDVPFGQGASPHPPAESIVFFTDRAIYRPGQTVFFKGLVLSTDPAARRYQAIADRPVTVKLVDANDQQVGQMDLRSNLFGSVQGTFSLPLGRLPGAWRLECGNPEGGTEIQVEEYKRPQFAVVLEPPEREFRLAETVKVPGRAESYSGAPLDSVRVHYRVTRSARFPWWGWRGGRPGGEQEIARGTVQADAAGHFEIPFVLRPDPAVRRTGDPRFSFRLTVEVTDGSGETRSDEAIVSAGYTGLIASITAPPVPLAGQAMPLTGELRSHGGRLLAGTGTVTIFALRGPARPVACELDPAGSRFSPENAEENDPSGWQNWPVGAKVATREFATGGEGKPATVLSFSLPQGAYRAVLESRDAAGQPVQALLPLLVLDSGGERLGVPIPFVFALERESWSVGETFRALTGTGYDQGPLRVEFLRDGRVLKACWTESARNLVAVELPVGEELRGGFTVAVTMVKENRLYQEVRQIAVPWSDRELRLRLTTFRDRLAPGQPETWQVQVSGAQAGPLAAEMVASLYDASLDQFLPHRFPGVAGLFARDSTRLDHRFSNRSNSFQCFFNRFNDPFITATPRYPTYPGEVFGAVNFRGRRWMAKGAMPEAMLPPQLQMMAAPQTMAAPAEGAGEDKVLAERPVEAGQDARATRGIQPRTNLAETAFFFPQLRTDARGEVTLSFRMPEALTRWRLLAFAHTPDLCSGALEAFTVTQRELMVQPNPPRFLREGDELEFPVKVSNLTDRPLPGKVRLRFADPGDERSLDADLGLENGERSFVLPPRESATLAWRIRVPDGGGMVSFEAAARAGEYSDGEAGMLPVLPRRIAVQETVPLWVNGPGENRFVLPGLKNAAASPAQQTLSLTVEMTGNPAWAAIMALPYLMEYPHECAEQICNRLYANALARHVAVSHPRIRAVFEQWRQAGGPVSPLEKNEELKCVILLESPWVLEGKSQTENQRRIGQLFDDNRMSDELRRAGDKLAGMKRADGSWPWFPGGPASEYITLYNVTSLGRLRHLGVTEVPDGLALSALDYLDHWIAARHERIRQGKRPADNHLDATAALYLYARTFFLSSHPLPAGKVRQAWDYWVGQGKRFWLSLGVQSQAQLALALHRLDDRVTGRKILRSLEERSQYSEELGRYWREDDRWCWYRAPIETQAVVIEAFAEITGDERTVGECQRWLLKQKQTQDWRTTKATADAVYALMCRGGDPLAAGAPVEVYLGGQKVEPGRILAGSESFQRRFHGEEVKPEMGDIRVVKGAPGTAWGGVHWHYLQDIDRLETAGGPLRVEKRLLVRRDTARGPALDPVAGPLAVGDRVVVRLELACDRELEFVHLTDARGSGLEPVEVLSGYRYQEGLGYYQAIRDTGVHFFFESLPKGRYVFEYPLVTVHRGRTQTGPARVQCMYAPEFTAHSAGIPLTVK